MESGAKTAIILGVVIAAVVAGISIGLSALDEAQPAVVERTIETESGEIITTLDKSAFKKAPEIVGIADYINTSPEQLQAEIEGNVVLYDIWTYSCINCIRTLPYITAWNDKYEDQGLLIIGIHSPEFEFEKDLENVQTAVAKHGITYPVVLDNDMETWKAFENRYWPRKYIADHEGYIRYDHIGEGKYGETELIIQDLLKERADALGIQTAAAQQLVDLDSFEHASSTPELYFGYGFARGNQLGNSEGFSPNNIVQYELPRDIEPNKFYINGAWENLEGSMKLTSESGQIVLGYRAKQVNIVAGNDAVLDISINGRPVPAEIRGSSVTEDSTITIGEHDLYNVISSEHAQANVLVISTDSPGFEIFTFTFG